MSKGDPAEGTTPASTASMDPHSQEDGDLGLILNALATANQTAESGYER